MRAGYLVAPLLAPLALALSPPANYINTAIARTVELIGATTQVTTQYNVKSTADSPGEYFLALAGAGDQEPAWWEVTVGGKEAEGVRVVPGEAPTVAVPLGQLKKDDTLTLSLSYALIHSSRALPASIEQKEAQYLMWTTNSTYVDSWYPADVERVKIRSPSPKILSTGTVPKTYTRDSDLTKASSTITLGPFHSLPATLGGSLEQQPFHVHYESVTPVMGYRSLVRSAEVSHWGNNLNIQDEISLANNGPKLKGHFSRLAHQQTRFHASSPAQVFTDLTYRLPPTAHSPYYYDTIGNVSTSRFRPGSTPAIQAKTKSRTSPRLVDSQLEIKPRYPILGGWNYSFVMGYDVPLEDVLKSDAAGQKILSVPFLTGYKDLAADQVELRIVLPEGAKDVTVHTPFPVDSVTHSVHKTYLDTTGRHAITLRKARCTENHAQNVYVTYTYPLAAHFQKPLAVATVVGGVFVLVMGLRRIDYSLDPKKSRR